MRYGILSDIHGNLEALKVVLDFYEDEGVSDFFCVGDIVGYGANPLECIDLVVKNKMVCVAGNHDWVMTHKRVIEYFNLEAREAILWTKPQLSDGQVKFFERLELTQKKNDLIFVHSTLGEPEAFFYLLAMSQVVETFDAMNEARVCFVGHTHVPKIIIQKESEIELRKDFHIDIIDGCKYIINVGSVGQPRDGDPRAACCIYDTDSGTLEIVRLEYNIATAQKKILDAGLPPFLAMRLAGGR